MARKKKNIIKKKTASKKKREDQPDLLIPDSILSNTVCCNEQKTEILAFLQTQSESLRPITNAEVSPDAVLVVLGLVIPKDPRRLPSLKTIKKIVRNLEKSNTPFLIIKGVQDLLQFCPDEKKIWGLEVTTDEKSDSTFQSMRDIFQQNKEAREESTTEPQK